MAVFQGGPRSFWGLWVHTDMWYYTTKGITQRLLTASHMRPEFHSLANPMGMGLWYCTTQGYDSKPLTAGQYVTRIPFTGQPDGNAAYDIVLPKGIIQEFSLAGQYETGIPFTGQHDGNGPMILYYPRMWFKDLSLASQYETGFHSRQPNGNGPIIPYYQSMIQNPHTGQSIWDRDSIHWPTRLGMDLWYCTTQAMIQRPLTGPSICDQDSIYWPTR